MASRAGRPGSVDFPAYSLVLLLMALPICACSTRTSPEEDPAACAALVAQTIDAPGDAYQLREIASCLGSARAEEASRVLAQAVRVADGERDTFQRVRSLPEAACIYVTIGRKKEALRLLSRAVVETPKIDSGGSRMAALQLIAEAYSYAGESELALRVARQAAPDPSSHAGLNTMHEAVCMVRIAFHTCRAGDKARAIELLSQACETAEGIERPFWRANALVDVVFGFAECGELDRALGIALQMAEEGKPGDDDLKGLAREGDLRFAPVLLKFVALVQVASKQTDLGNLERAREALSHAHAVATRVPDRYRVLKSELMKDVALAHAGTGQYDADAMGLRKERSAPPDLPKATEIARAVEHPLLRAIALGRMAEVCRKRGDRDGCLRTLAEAVTVVKAIADASPDGCVSENGFAERYKLEVLCSLAKGYAEAGQFEQALQVASSITKHERFGDRRPDALVHIASAYVKQGERAKALSILKQAADAHAPGSKLAPLFEEAGEHEKALEAASDDAEILEGLAVRCAKAGRFDHAVETAARIADPYHQALGLVQIGKELSASRQVLSKRAKEVLREIARKAEPQASAKP